MVVKPFQKQYQVLAEFAIGFPILLFLFFGIMQLVFIYLDHIVVKYAAYQAARAYVSSTDLDLNGISLYDPQSDPVKGPISDDDRAHLAAALICTPMTFGAKPSNTGVTPTWFFINGTQPIHWPGWSQSTNALRRVEEAWHCTNVRVINNNEPSNPNAEYVEVEVDHDLLLIFPVADFMISNAAKIFGSDYDTINSRLAPEYHKVYTDGNYHRVTAKCILPIQSFVSNQYAN